MIEKKKFLSVQSNEDCKKLICMIVLLSENHIYRGSNRQKRFRWAQFHKNWTMDEWKQVLWTNESKFEVFENKQRVYVRRSVKEKMLFQCLVSTVKHGEGSVIVWGCFSLDGVGGLRKIDSIMRKGHYRDILETSAISSGLRLIGDNFILMHDNDPKHTALLCRNYL